MTSTAPPRVATWMLLHLMPGDHDEALAGDLLESFRAGSSSVWYSRQVLVAILIQWTGSLFRNLNVLIFAAAWATISPAWSLLMRRLDQWHNLIGPVWRLPWPWSTVCDIGLSTAETLLFVWTGVLICLLMLLSAFGTVRHWRIGRAFALSVAGFVLACVCEIAIACIYGPATTGHAVDWRRLTLSGAIINFGVWSVFSRLPYLVATACALWGSIPPVDRRFRLTE
jgi:hypothetical protein